MMCQTITIPKLGLVGLEPVTQTSQHNHGFTPTLAAEILTSTNTTLGGNQYQKFCKNLYKKM
jgi:hypothetical protein